MARGLLEYVVSALPNLSELVSLIISMILGMDWIDHSGAFVFSCNGTGYVDV